MKKLFAIFMTAGLAIGAAVSCSELQPEENCSKVVKAYFADESTKTSLVDGQKIGWSSSDKISAFDLDCYNNPSTNTSVSADGACATFTIGSMSLSDDIYIAMYPYDAAAEMNDACVITTTLPQTQTATEGGFDPKANLSLADGGTEDLYFMNCGALLRVDVKNDDITKISLTSGALYENIAGPCYVSFDSNDEPLMQSTYAAEYRTVSLEGEFVNGSSYYFVVMPGTYTKPTIEFTDKDGKTASYTQKNDLEVSRNDNLLIFDKVIPASKFEASDDTPVASSYALVTALTDVTAGEYIITAGGYMLPNAAATKGANEAKAISAVTDLSLADDVISGDASAYAWTFTGTSTAAMTITSAVASKNVLYAVKDNNGITIGNSSTCTWAITENNAANRTFYMQESVNSRYLALYNNSNFRSYTGKTTGNQSIKLYKKTSGSATLKNLETPVLAIGATDASSITITWTNDSKATNGYNCSIYDSSDTKLDKDQNGVKSGSVTFSDLTANASYTIKVYAVAVEGEYNASETASITASTYLAQTVSSVNAAGTYVIKDLTVLATNNNGMYVVGDATGKMLLYKSGSSYAAGTSFDADGPVVSYNGVWRYNVTTLSNITTGNECAHGTAAEVTDSYMTDYVAKPVVEYVHFKTTVGTSSALTIGGQAVTSYSPLTSWYNKKIEAYGYFIGYNSSKLVCFIATTIREDATSLSIDAASKTWKSDETDAFVVNVTAENGSWTVSPTTLDWATVTADVTAGTITVTPKGANSSDADYTATLTVTHTEDATLTKTISLTQKKASSAPADGYVTLTMTSTSVTDSDSGTTVAATIGSGKSNPAFSSSELRLYASNKVTVSSDTTITKIELTYHKQGSKDYIASVSASTGTFTSGGASTASDELVTDTWEGSASSVVFTMGASGQRVLTEVKVYF